MLSPERGMSADPPLAEHGVSSQNSSSSTRPVGSSTETHRQYGSVLEGAGSSPMRMRLALASGILASAMLACLVYASGSSQSAVEGLSNIYLNGSPALVSSVGYGSPAMQMPVGVHRLQDTGAEWVQAAGQLIPVQASPSYGSLSSPQPLLNFPQPAATSQVYPSSLPIASLNPVGEEAWPYTQAEAPRMIAQPLMMAPQQPLTPLTPLAELPQGGVAMVPDYAAVQPVGFLAQQALIREISEQAGNKEAEPEEEEREEGIEKEEQKQEKAKTAAARYGAAYGASYAAAYNAMLRRPVLHSMATPMVAPMQPAGFLMSAQPEPEPEPEPEAAPFSYEPTPPQPKPQYLVEHQVATLGGQPVSAAPVAYKYPLQQPALRAVIGPHVQYMYSGNPLAAAARAVAQARGAAMSAGGA